MKPLSDGHFEVRVINASIHNNDQCGSNGLPLTPNSIRITGKFQQLKTIIHPNICCYVDLKRSKHGELHILFLPYELYACLSPTIAIIMRPRVYLMALHIAFCTIALRADTLTLG